MFDTAAQIECYVIEHLCFYLNQATDQIIRHHVPLEHRPQTAAVYLLPWLNVK